MRGRLRPGASTPAPQTIRAVYRRLRAAYGAPPARSTGPAVDCLVGTVLSQHTSDTNSARAFSNLKSRFPSWDEAAEATSAELASAIRSGGLAAQKAPRLKSILTTIREREGRIDLARLEGLSDEEVDRYLCSLPGVGPKTSACVMAFAMGRDAFPIDTHVHRILGRVGWITPRTSAEAASRELAPRIPASIRYPLHVLLIEHGRRICRARSPLCRHCAVFRFCAAGPRFLAADVAH